MQSSLQLFQFEFSYQTVFILYVLDHIRHAKNVIILNKEVQQIHYRVSQEYLQGMVKYYITTCMTNVWAVTNNFKWHKYMIKITNMAVYLMTEQH